jgi:hypothetical protein
MHAPALDPRTRATRIRRYPERLQAAARVWVQRRYDVVTPGATSISACRNPRTSKRLLCTYPARPRFRADMTATLHRRRVSYVPGGSLRCFACLGELTTACVRGVSALYWCPFLHAFRFSSTCGTTRRHPLGRGYCPVMPPRTFRHTSLDLPTSRLLFGLARCVLS